MTQRRKNAAISCIEDAVHELFLVMKNDGQLYGGWKYVVEHLYAEKKAGTYSDKKAYTRFEVFVREGARRYKKAHPDNTYNMTSSEVIEQTTTLYVNDFNRQYKLGELDWLKRAANPVASRAARLMR